MHALFAPEQGVQNQGKHSEEVLYLRKLLFSEAPFMAGAFIQGRGDVSPAALRWAVPQ